MRAWRLRFTAPRTNHEPLAVAFDLAHAGLSREVVRLSQQGDGALAVTGRCCGVGTNERILLKRELRVSAV